MSFRSPLLTKLAAVGAAVAGLLAAAPVASAADPIQLVSPAPDGMVRRADAVRITLNRRPPGSRVDVWVDTKRVTARPGPTVASFPASSLRRGTHEVLVRVRRKGKPPRSISRRFVVAARDADLLRPLSSATARAAAAANGSKTVAGVRASTVPTRVWFVLNGRRVPARDEWSGGRTHTVVLSPDDGLRFGRNRLVARAYDAKRGVWDVQPRTILRPRNAPLAAAGGDRTTAPKRAIRLDARGSLAARGGDLSYAWRVVSAPKGSTADMRGATTSRPRFTPDRAGVYKVAVRVRETSRGAHAAQAGASSEDVVTVTAAPPIPPAGMQVSMTTGSLSRTTLTVPAAAAGGTPWSYVWACPASNVCTVQLDSSTLAVTTSSAVPSGQPTPAPAAGLITLQTDWSNNTTTVWVGTKQIIKNADAWQNGSTTGALQRDVAEGDTFYGTGPGGKAPQYTFNTNAYHTFATRTETGASQTNTMRVDGQTWTQSLGAGQSGFMLLALDADLQPMQGTPWAFVTNGNPAGQDQTALADAQALIDRAKAGGYMVMLQSIGSPHFDNAAGIGQAAWDAFGEHLQSTLGGNQDLWDELSPYTSADGGNYALVGNPNHVTNPGAGDFEADAKTGLGGGVLSGGLSLAADATLVPTAADSSAADAGGAASRFALNPLAFAAPTSWPVVPGTTQDAAHQAAFQSVQSQSKTLSGVNLGSTTQSICPGAPDKLRAIYCIDDAPGSQTLDDVKDEIRDASVQGTGYDAQDLTDVRNSVIAEIDQVEDVRSWIEEVDQLLGGQAGSGKTDRAQELADKINAGIPGHSTGNASNALNAFAALLAVGSTFADFEGFEAIALISNVAWTASAGAPGATALNDPIMTNITTTAATAAAKLDATFETYQDYLDRIGDLIVSDPAKLAAADANMSGVGPWHFQSDDVGLTNAIGGGMNQWLWGQILASGYQVWVSTSDLTSNLYCSQVIGDSIDNYQPFKNAPSGTWDAGEPHANQSYWMGDKSLGVYKNNVTPPNVLGPLYAKYDPNSNPLGGGAQFSWFTRRYFTFVTLPPHVNHHGTGQDGCQAKPLP